jgi:hypothetical protein
MIQLKRKEYKEHPRLVNLSTLPKKKTSTRAPMTSTTRQKLLNQLTFEHPTSSLRVGTLQSKVNEVLTSAPELRSEVIDCIRLAVWLAWTVKLRCQEIIGRYLEIVFAESCQAEPTDLTFLDALYERKSTDANKKEKDADNKEKEDHDDEDEEEDEDEQIDIGAKGGEQMRFLHTFTTFLYSGIRPIRRGDVSVLVDDFITRLEGLGLLDKEPVSRSSLRGQEYRASDVTRTVAVQIKAELKRHYHYGREALVEKVFFMSTFMAWMRFLSNPFSLILKL